MCKAALRLAQRLLVIVNQASNFRAHCSRAQKMEGDKQFSTASMYLFLYVLQAKAHMFLPDTYDATMYYIRKVRLTDIKGIAIFFSNNAA